MAASKGPRPAWSAPRGWRPSRRPCSPCSSQGDHVVLSDGLYGKTTTLVARELLAVRRHPRQLRPGRPESLAKLLTSQTRLVFAETISNPLLRVADLEAIARVAREADVPVLVDHTFAPLLCRPIALGATLVMHSVTKLIGGHSDLTLGAVAGPRDRIDRIAGRRLDLRPDGQPVRELAGPARAGDAQPAHRTRASATALDLAGRLEAPSRGSPASIIPASRRTPTSTWPAGCSRTASARW